MRESIGSTWSIQAIIFFILIFAAFLSLVIQYSKAYQVKNESLSIIEKYEGMTVTSKEVIDNYLNSSGYHNKGKCSSDWVGVSDYGVAPETAQDGTNYLYCYQEIDSKTKGIYYNVLFFYKFNLPVIGELTTFRVHGTTKTFVGANKRIVVQ